MVPGEWELSWLTDWPEVMAPKKPKAFLGIGPDDMRMARGCVLPFPYLANGTINEAYFKEVDDMIRHKKNIAEILANPLPIKILKAFRDAMQRITEQRLLEMEARLLKDALAAQHGGENET